MRNQAGGHSTFFTLQNYYNMQAADLQADSEVYLLIQTSYIHTIYYTIAVADEHYSNHKIFLNDSKAPNKVVSEWLNTQEFTKVVPEYTYGNCRCPPGLICRAPTAEVSTGHRAL